jgi:hypothetical protein
LFSPLWHTLSITWGSYTAVHKMTRNCHIVSLMITAVSTHLWMFLNSKFCHLCINVEFYLLLTPVLGGSSLHWTVPSMNRLNQTEPATCSILPLWTFFRDSYFLYFKAILFRKRLYQKQDLKAANNLYFIHVLILIIILNLVLMVKNIVFISWQFIA